MNHELKTKIYSDYVEWLYKRHGFPIALVSQGRVIAISFDGRGDRFWGLDLPEDGYLIPFQRDSAQYWERHHSHRGPLGVDRGVIVDGGLFPHVLEKTPRS